MQPFQDYNEQKQNKYITLIVSYGREFVQKCHGKKHF